MRGRSIIRSATTKRSRALSRQRIEDGHYFYQGKIYELINTDRSWPLPKVLLDGQVVGHITSATDHEGETTREIKIW